MITFTKGFRDSQGTLYALIEEAQKSELTCLLTKDEGIPVEPMVVDVIRNIVVGIILKQKDQVIDILTTKPHSRPRARKVNGGTKQRKSAKPEIQT